MTGDSKKKKFIVIAIVLVLAIIGLVVFLVFRESIKATTMRILRLEGTVSLQDDSGMKSVKENLRLVSGNVLDTSVDSLVSIGLDDVKIVTLDELSRAKFNQSGKYLNLDLTKGSLFFEVDKPLADDETFEIETSTMIVGIRGTSGWVSVEGEHESLIITDGHVNVVGTNPVTKEVKQIEVHAGQRLIVYLYNDREVDSIMFELEDITEHELSEFVLEILRNNPDLLDRVIAATGWDREWILGISDAEPEPDDDQVGTQVADADPEPSPEPEPEPDTEPVIPDVDGNDPGPAQGNGGNNNNTNHNNNNNNGNNNNNNNTGNNGNAVTETLTTAPVTVSELERQVNAAMAQVVSTNADGTYTLADSTVFDPDYYAQAYPDVVAQYGDGLEELLAHYVAVGQSEGRYASQSEQDAAKLAEDIARLEAQRIADEAAAAQAASNTNNNQQQQQNNNPSRVTGGNQIEFVSGAKGTYNAGQITLTDPDSAQTYTATLPATYADENGVDQNVSLANISVDTSSNIGTVDASAINATPSQIAQWLHSTNSGTATKVIDSPTTYEAIMPQGPGTPDIVASVSLNDANTISSVNSIIPLLNSDIDRVRLDGTYVSVEYATGAPSSAYPYVLEWGQTNAAYVQYDSAASNSNVAAFHDANGNDYYIHADGTVNNTP